MSEPESGGAFDVRIAWRRDDPRLETDAIAMWTRLGVLAEGVKPEDRAKQLVSVAYRGDQLAAVATAVVEPVKFLRARFLVLRSMTVPEFRRSYAQVSLGIPSITALTEWAKANPEEKIAGMIALRGAGGVGRGGADADRPVLRLDACGLHPGRQAGSRDLVRPFPVRLRRGMSERIR